uniref:Golgin B1 n=1 Tax=Gasterosteus aculeatus TaxID=69293 RepID=G3Q941_GASAC
ELQELKNKLSDEEAKSGELREQLRAAEQLLRQEQSAHAEQTQILTAQFRQMEQELAEGFQRREEERQQWAEQASRADAEIAALRGGLEELERQEGELESLREAELASREALGEEKDASERETSEVDKLERELASLREEHRDAQRKGESKGASSDEMVASSDSEVAHSSWTLFTDGDMASGQVFAQALAEELQRRYSELLAELQILRQAAAESQEKIKNLEEDTQSLIAAKEEAESRASHFIEELKSAREESEQLSQKLRYVVEKHSVEMHLLEDQVDILSTESTIKEETIQALQTDLEMSRRAFSEQEGQARMLSAQLEDRELLSSELERKLQDAENSLLEYSQTSEKKVQEAQESRKETIRKAKEKDRHHREQLKQQKEEHSALVERFEVQGGEREELLAKVTELEEKVAAAKEPRQEAGQPAQTELRQKMESGEDELQKLRAEKAKLIDEVDRTLLENQSLGSSCESLKLAMDGILTEKDAWKREVELAKEVAAAACGEWEEKVQSMKDEYETLLKSYENVSDEAERVRRVLEAARQERQELLTRVRGQEAGRQEAERRAEEAQKEVNSVKDKMRKFAKTKQQKILELEEENERLGELQDKDVIKREGRALKAEVERLQEETVVLKAELDAAVAEKTSLGRQVEALREQLAQEAADNRRRLAELQREAERLGAELKEMELRLEEVDRERDREEEATLEAREIAGAAERRAQEMQARLDESLARLAAFSRCMSSLQDDRDRVLDETRQWETRFNDALKSKEAEVREAETRAKELTEQLQRESALKDGLQLLVDRLEKADKDWQLKLEEEVKKVAASQADLEVASGKLQQTATEMQSAQHEARALKTEAESLNQRARALEEAVGRLQGEAERARAELREREAEERRTELNEKERREVEMLGEKEQAVTQAAEDAKKEADSRAKGAEEELERRRGELRDLAEKLRKAEEESSNRKARLDSFTKAMSSLQDDRDRVLNTYKQLEEKHLQVMMEKDALIQEAAGENNGLREELRSLLVQRDDLYAEKAQLSAQLHGYRDELTQVLSMKDSQHKQLLATQRQRIASLEKERQELEERETLSRAADGLGAPPPPVTDAPGAEVEKLREQLRAARDQAAALEESLRQERQAQESGGKELAELRWEGGVMRTESENAQERVAELARDLLAVEQNLLEERAAATRLRAENQSFSRAMASLQDSRDQAVSKAQENDRERLVGPTPKADVNEASGSTMPRLFTDAYFLFVQLEQLQAQSSEIKALKSELARLGAGELIKVSRELIEEKAKNEDLLGDAEQLENEVELGKREIETLRLECVDWRAQAEQLKQQTLATLSERDQQLRQLAAMLEEARAQQPKLQQEQYQR